MGGLLHLVQRGGDWAGPTSLCMKLNQNGSLKPALVIWILDIEIFTVIICIVQSYNLQNICMKTNQLETVGLEPSSHADLFQC